MTAWVNLYNQICRKEKPTEYSLYKYIKIIVQIKQIYLKLPNCMD